MKQSFSTCWFCPPLTLVFLLIMPFFILACQTPSKKPESQPEPSFKSAPLYGDESRYFSQILELTDTGENAEGYFSFDDRYVIYQATVPPYACDQQYILDLKTGRRKRVSHGLGRTTCGFFLPDNYHILYASTEHVTPACPPRPDYSRGYVWALYDYDLYLSDIEGKTFRPLFKAPGYQAEATVHKDGRIVFTSDHEGDLELYMMEPDHQTIHRLTHTPGYDGGAFFSPDGEWIVYRASRPSGPDLETYFQLLRDHLVRPFHLEIFIQRVDGSEVRQLTRNGAANFAPYFTPNQKKVIFASNMENPRSRNFDLYTVDIESGEIERITFYEGFDSFPMFSNQCDYLIFASNRTERQPGQTNLYLARLTEEARTLWCSHRENP